MQIKYDKLIWRAKKPDHIESKKTSVKKNTVTETTERKKKKKL